MISANHVNWSLIGPQFTMELQGAVSLWCRTERCWFSQNHILNIKTGNVNELKIASTVHICYYSNCLIRTSSITLHSWSIRLHLLSVFLSLPACLPASVSLSPCCSASVPLSTPVLQTSPPTRSVSHTYCLPARSLLLSDKRWAMDCSYESDVCPSWSHTRLCRTHTPLDLSRWSCGKWREISVFELHAFVFLMLWLNPLLEHLEFEFRKMSHIKFASGHLLNSRQLSAIIAPLKS